MKVRWCSYNICSLYGSWCVAATPEPQTPGHAVQQALPVPEFTPILVSISYSLKNPADGIQFVQPSESYQTVSGLLSYDGMTYSHLYSEYLTFTRHRPRRTRRAAGSHVSIIFGRNAHGTSNLSCLGHWNKMMYCPMMKMRVPPLWMITRLW